MDILFLILEGRGGGKKPKNILRHSYRNSSVASLALGAYYKTSFQITSFQMTLCYLIVSLNDTVDGTGITTLTYQSKSHLTEKGLTTNGRIYNLS